MFHHRSRFLIASLACAFWGVSRVGVLAADEDGIPDDVIVHYNVRYREGSAKEWVLDLALPKDLAESSTRKLRPAIARTP